MQLKSHVREKSTYIFSSEEINSINLGSTSDELPDASNLSRKVSGSTFGETNINPALQIPSSNAKPRSKSSPLKMPRTISPTDISQTSSDCSGDGEMINRKLRRILTNSHIQFRRQESIRLCNLGPF